MDFIFTLPPLLVAVIIHVRELNQVHVHSHEIPDRKWAFFPDADLIRRRVV